MSFEQAIEYVRTLPPTGSVVLNNEQKLKFYGLYKQATIGDVEGTQPWAVQVETRAKWDAWEKNKGMDKDTAKAKYVEELTAFCTTYGEDWTSKITK